MALAYLCKTGAPVRQSCVHSENRPLPVVDRPVLRVEFRIRLNVHRSGWSLFYFPQYLIRLIQVGYSHLVHSEKYLCN